MEAKNTMETKEIFKGLKRKGYVRLKNLSISRDHSSFLYRFNLSPQKILTEAIEKLVKEAKIKEGSERKKS